MKIEAGSVAVITGGSSGIGFGLAEVLGSRGVKLMIADIRSESVEPAAELLRRRGIDVVAMVVDVADPLAVKHLADATMLHYGRVDLVCNNAGVTCAQLPMWEQDLETWRRMIDVKVMGVVHGIRSFAPLFVAQMRGHFLNTASAAGLMPLPTMTPYSGTMHAIVGMTESVNLELRAVSSALGATVFCPGMVRTSLRANSEQIGAVAADPEARARAAATVATIGDSAMTPVEAATAAIAAVEANRVHAVPGSDVHHLIVENARAIITDVEASRAGTP